MNKNIIMLRKHTNNSIYIMFFVDGKYIDTMRQNMDIIKIMELIFEQLSSKEEYKVFSFNLEDISEKAFNNFFLNRGRLYLTEAEQFAIIQKRTETLEKLFLIDCTKETIKCDFQRTSREQKVIKLTKYLDNIYSKMLEMDTISEEDNLKMQECNEKLNKLCDELLEWGNTKYWK